MMNFIESFFMLTVSAPLTVSSTILRTLSIAYPAAATFFKTKLRIITEKQRLSPVQNAKFENFGDYKANRYPPKVITRHRFDRRIFQLRNRNNVPMFKSCRYRATLHNYFEKFTHNNRYCRVTVN